MAERVRVQVEIDRPGHKKEEMKCRPLGFLLGLPFAMLALFFSLFGVALWIIGAVLSCMCPCCEGLEKMAEGLIKLPHTILLWFTNVCPC